MIHPVARAVLGKIAPHGSRRRHLLRALSQRVQPQPEPVWSIPPSKFTSPPNFSVCETPQVSVVLCVFNQLPSVSRCVAALATSDNSTSFELIVVDDASGPETAEFLDQLKGVSLIRHVDNRGFVTSARSGADHARGEIVVFLNSDVVVTPGWLDELVFAFSDESVAVAGPKMVYPSGRLQEAGGIIWSDGTGVNFGRGDRRHTRPEYDYWRFVDYVSGACLAVRRDFYEEIGGFDQRYAPAYFEDTDLCFQARALGRRVMYVSTSLVVHAESASYRGIDSGLPDLLKGRNRPVFEKKWRVLLNHHFEPLSVESVVASRRAIEGQGTVVFIDYFPRPRHDSGGERRDHFLHAIQRRGYSVVFISLNAEQDAEYLRSLQRRGIPVMRAEESRTRAIIRKIRGSIVSVIAARPEGMRYWRNKIRPVLPEVPVLFDTVDLHFLRLERQLETGVRRKSHARRVRRMERLELSFARQAELTLVTSSHDRQTLRARDRTLTAEIVSNAHAAPTGLVPAWDNRSGLVFVGNFDHLPNSDGLRWFLTEVFPLVKQELADVVLHVVGTPAPDWVEEMDTESVVVHGWVPRTEDIYAHRLIAIAPLRFGAGLKGKVAQAWTHGVPTVVTSIAAEGYEIQNGENALLADSAEQFARGIVSLYLSRALWEKVSQSSRVVALDRFGTEAFFESVANLPLRVVRHPLPSGEASEHARENQELAN